MKLLFNQFNEGHLELKKHLGFLDGNFKYQNLEPDIKLNTPYLIDLVGQNVYNKIHSFYAETTNVSTESEVALHNTALGYMQLYLASMAYLDYAPDNDLNHSNSGRSFRAEDNEKIPWDWQIMGSNANIKRRAYRALDHLMQLLDTSSWQEWTDSPQFTKANDLLIKNTLDFDSVFPINKSGQLYYKLVPFMEDYEQDQICAILTDTVYNTIKTTPPSTTEDNLILRLSKKAVAYATLSKAMKAFPVEMLPESLVYHETNRVHAIARAETMQFLKSEADRYLIRLEHELAKSNTTYVPVDPMQGLNENSKHVNL